MSAATIGTIALPVAPTLDGSRAIDQSAASATEPMDLAHSFVHTLAEARRLEGTAQTASTQFSNGDPHVGIHEVMIETEKASIALRYATTLKNKALEAYRELMNTQV